MSAYIRLQSPYNESSSAWFLLVPLHPFLLPELAERIDNRGYAHGDVELTSKHENTF